MTKEKLLRYSKEDLVDYIMKYSWNRNIDNDLISIHIENLIVLDEKLTKEADQKEKDLLERLMKMPETSYTDELDKIKVYKKYIKLKISNAEKYKERQSEISDFMNIKLPQSCDNS